MTSKEQDFNTYAQNMRLQFSNKEMIDNTGNINHKYFLVKKGAYWSNKEDEALMRGIELFGKFYKMRCHGVYNNSSITLL